LRPVLFYIASVAVRSYDVIVVLGMIAGFVVIYRRTRRAGLGRAEILLGGLCIILVSLVGSRVGNVIVDLEYYVHNWREIFSLYGTGFQGGLIAGILAVFVFARYLRVSFWKLADLFAPGLILGQAIGRIGCFLNGCCYGRVTDSFLGVYLPGYGEGWAYRYPTQIMHSLANLFIFAVLLAVSRRRRPFDGFVFGLYAILYSTQRLLIDFLRDDACPTIAGIRATELVSAATIIIVVILMAWKWARVKADSPEDKAGFIAG